MVADNIIFSEVRAVSDWGSGRGRDNPFGIHTIDDAYAQAPLKGIVIYRRLGRILSTRALALIRALKRRESDEGGHA